MSDKKDERIKQLEMCLEYFINRASNGTIRSKRTTKIYEGILKEQGEISKCIVCEGLGAYELDVRGLRECDKCVGSGYVFTSL